MSFQYYFMTFGEKKNRVIIYHLKQPIEGGFAGMATSKRFSATPALVVDDSLLAEGIPGRLSATPGKPLVKVELTREMFYGIKQNRKIARVTLFHELGHYFHNHYQDGKLDTEEYLWDRYEAAKAGGVLQMEQEADLFAAEYLGTDYACDGLRELIEYTQRQAETGIVTDTEETELAIAELERRIELLKISQFLSS